MKRPPTTRARRGQPSFALRGLHLNGWSFGYPYTFRRWKEADWRRYIDCLASQGANLFFLWPFMEIIPLPLSTADRSYLAEVRRVVAYAQQQHGMEVWIFQSPNRVALNDCGVRDPRCRPYWVLKEQGDYPATGQVDLDPGDPQQFARIMQARTTLYRLVNNADGYVTIDSDPGGWEGSPLADLMKLFKASRAQIDRVCVRGKQTKLIHWLWSGWGQPGWWTRNWSQAEETKFMRQTIRAMKRELPEPWWVLAGSRAYLPACAAEGILGKTVYLPYNVIEAEPSRPGTQINFPLQRKHLDAAADYPGLAGLMGNVQTPLLQFPHVSHFLNTARNYDLRKRTPRESLRDLAAQVYPDRRDLLVDCWLALSPAGRLRAGKQARRLERLLQRNQLGRLGPVGRTIFPDQRQLARDLVWQLKEAAAFESFCGAARCGTSPARCARKLEGFIAAALDWDQQHGWSAYWRKIGRPWTLWPDRDPAYPVIVRGLRKMLGGDAVLETTVAEFLAPIGQRLARRYDAWIVAQCALAPLREAILKMPVS